MSSTSNSSSGARYGLPYQGSKNGIARWIVDHLPAADVLVDAFAGGCAITHAAYISEYTMPAGFTAVAARRKTVLSAAVGALYNTERLFVQARHAAAHQPLTLFG